MPANLSPASRDFALGVFTSEIGHLAEDGLYAWEQIRGCLETRRQPWFYVHAFVTIAGNVSKLLWPPSSNRDPKPVIRGHMLREHLGIKDDSALRDRTLRDHLEHFDSRLETWAATSTRHNFADRNIGVVNGISGIDPGDVIRSYEPLTNSVHFRGADFPLEPIRDALATLLAQVHARNRWTNFRPPTAPLLKERE